MSTRPLITVERRAIIGEPRRLASEFEARERARMKLPARPEKQQRPRRPTKRDDATVRRLIDRGYSLETARAIAETTS